MGPVLTSFIWDAARCGDFRDVSDEEEQVDVVTVDQPKADRDLEVMETAVETKTEIVMPQLDEREATPVDTSEVTTECADKNGPEMENSGSSVGSGNAPLEEVPAEVSNSSEEHLSDAKEATPEPPSKIAETPESAVPEAKGKSESPTKPKSKKKEDKSIEHILRALNSLSTTEEKLAALCKKYADLHEEHRVLQTSFKQSQRRMTVVTREKDQLQSEHTKAVMAKSKLESLCRELQKHNRLIKEESLTRAREEDEKRKEISNKFQTTIGEIQTQMTDNHERNTKLREENADLATKLKNFIEQYELREQQVEKIMKHRELEKQLGDAKLAQANAIMAEQEERGKKEKELLVLQATESQKKAQVLEAQLTMYKDRYEEFQSTINRSNEMFQKFKTEMDKMAKRIKKLEKEGASWRAKWETSNKALLELAEQKRKVEGNMSMMSTKSSKLESLCRALQAELHGKKPEPVQTTQENITKNIVAPTTPPNTPERKKKTQDKSSEPGSLSTLEKKMESITLSEGVNDKTNDISNISSPDKTTKGMLSEKDVAESEGKTDIEETSKTADSPVESPSEGETTGEIPVETSGEGKSPGEGETCVDTPGEGAACVETSDNGESRVGTAGETPGKDQTSVDGVSEEAVPSDYNIADVD